MEPETDTARTLDVTILRKAGLTESQAKGYLALIEYGALSPVELAEKTGENRTNGYMICDKLVTLGLATKKNGRKAIYTPNHPSAVEALAERRRKVVSRNEQEVKQNISPLIDLFYAHNELPGTRTLQGIAGIKSVYEDTLREGKDIYLIRTTRDNVVLSDEYFDTYRRRRAEAGIETYALTPLTAVSLQHMHSGADEKMHYHRTPLPEGAYTGTVELDIYGNKTALIAFGDTQMAIIIDSPAVAEAMRQLCQLLIAAYQRPPTSTHSL